MKKLFILALLAGSWCCYSCKGKKPADEAAASGTTTPAGGGAIAGASNSTKMYQVSFAPDSAILGKSQEALIKLAGATAVALQDPDGKDNGTELSVRLTLTNKLKIGQGSSIHVDYPDSRLQLDNGNNITCEKGSDFLRADQEATSHEETWTYAIPAGAKPKGLTLFMDGTRVSVGITLKE